MQSYIHHAAITKIWISRRESLMAATVSVDSLPPYHIKQCDFVNFIKKSIKPIIKLQILVVYI